MIAKEIKKKLIAELSKDGNILSTCRKIGISRSTFYRWYNGDSGFQKRSDRAIKMGRANLSDIAEHALMINVKKLDMGAIKYVLVHNSPYYKPRPRKTMIEHSHYGEREDELRAKERDLYEDITESYRKIGELIADLKDDERLDHKKLDELKPPEDFPPPTKKSKRRN